MAQPQTILFTRRRWDRLFALSTGSAAVVAGVCIFLTGHIRYCFVPLGVIGMWAYFRRSTPEYGVHIQTIEGNPWTIRLLIWLGLVLVWTACFLAFDIIVLNNPINGPLHWYHWLFLVATVCLMTAGCGLIQRASDRAEESEESDEPADALESPSRKSSQ